MVLRGWDTNPANSQNDLPQAKSCHAAPSILAGLHRLLQYLCVNRAQLFKLPSIW
jgi:hypothetical protein